MVKIIFVFKELATSFRAEIMEKQCVKVYVRNITDSPEL
jgi:hypothetical protein